MSDSSTVLQASTTAELEYYFMTLPCPSCGQGPWDVQLPAQVSAEGEEVQVRATCRHCSQSRQFSFQIRNPSSRAIAGLEQINPEDSPSSLIDLAQWVALFRKFVESAAGRQDKTQARKLGYQAAMCLQEALKFYAVEDEFPEEAAFFHEASRQARQRNPAMFAKQNLRDMQAKLPSLEVMETNLKRDARKNRPRWWQFWKK